MGGALFGACSVFSAFNLSHVVLGNTTTVSAASVATSSAVWPGCGPSLNTVASTGTSVGGSSVVVTGSTYPEKAVVVVRPVLTWLPYPGTLIPDLATTSITLSATSAATTELMGTPSVSGDTAGCKTI